MDKNNAFEVSNVPINQTQRMKQQVELLEKQQQYQQQQQQYIPEHKQINLQMEENYANQQNIQFLQNYPDQAINPQLLVNQIKQIQQPRFMSDHNQFNIQNNMKNNSQQQYNFVSQNFKFAKNPVENQQMKMQVQYPNMQYQNFQNQQPQQQQYGYLVCREHYNSNVTLICFCTTCQYYSRLVCLHCITNNYHKDHLNQLLPLEYLYQLKNEDFIDKIGTISDKISQIQQKGEQYYDENITDVENQISILEKEYNELFQYTRKNILVQISENNSTQSEQMSKSLIKIQEMFSCGKLKQAIAQFIEGPQLQDQRIVLEETIKNYGTIYNSNQLLDQLLPKKKLLVNTAKLELVNQKLKEAISILSEVTTPLDQLSLKFQASNLEDSKNSLKILNNGLIIKNLGQNIAVAFTQKPLVATQTYDIQIQVLEGDISNHLCWGVILVKEKYVNDSQNLVWLSQEKGLFCCFDGDCNSIPNSLKSQTKVSLKLECPQFNITFNQQNKIFKIVSKDKLFDYSLTDSKQIVENEKYFLGIALLNNFKISIKVDF
ncbi:hypothetical protein ABPG74_013640 [Tetrahymena malaccensis]